MGGLPNAKEYVLLKARQRRNTVEELRFVIGYKAKLLNRAESQEVEDFNNLLKLYEEVYNPNRVYERQATVDDNKDMLDKIKNMGPLKVTKVGGKVEDNMTISSGKKVMRNQTIKKKKNMSKL